VVLFAEAVDLGLAHAGVGKHSNLIGDVAPVVNTTCVLKLLNEASSHVGHSSGHVSEVLVPAGGEVLVSEDDVDDSGSVEGRVGVHRSGEGLQSSADGSGFLGAASKDTEVSSSLTVKSEVLGERLEEDESVGVLGEESDGVSVLFEVSTGEALVGAIHADHVVLSLDHFEDLLPLVVGGVLSGRVVGASVQNDDLLLRCSVEILKHAVAVESSVRSVEISVGLHVETSLGSDSVVSRPGGVGNHDFSVLVRVPFSQEFESNSQGSGSGKGLEGGNTA